MRLEELGTWLIARRMFYGQGRKLRVKTWYSFEKLLTLAGRHAILTRFIIVYLYFNYAFGKFF
jgi:hypothetical protein